MSPVHETAYSIRFDLSGVPELPNALRRTHWSNRAYHARLWRTNVVYAARMRKPPAPLSKAKVTIEMWRKREPDPDNLVASAKPILDGLQPPREDSMGRRTIGAGVIADDRAENFEGGKPEVIYHKCARGEKPHCVVTVTEVT